MNGTNITESEIFRELQALKKENAALKVSLNKYISETENRFQYMADTAPMLVWQAGTDTLCYYFNQTWLDFTGRTMKQEYGNGWAEGVHPDDLQRCLDIYLGAFHAHRKFRMEYRLRRADGEYRWLSDNGAPWFTPEGEFAGYIGLCADITEVKNAQDILAENNSRLALAMNAANIAWWEMDVLTGDITFSSHKAEMLGFPPENFKHYKDFMSLVHPDDYESAMEAMRSHFKGKTDKYETDYRIKTISGDYKYFHDIGSIQKRDASGMPTYISGLVIDITARKMAENSLLESEEFNRTLFMKSPDAYLTIVDGIFTECNHATEIMLRGERSQIIGQPPEILSPEYQPDGRKSSLAAEENINQAIKKGRHSFEWVHRRFDGTNFFADVSIAAMMINDKPALFTTWRDITERKKAEDELNVINEELLVSKSMIEENLFQQNALVEELTVTKDELEKINSIKDKFFSIIAHDLKSPFQGLVGLTELLADDINSFSLDELSKLCREISDNSKNLLKLLINLLEWARMQQGSISFIPVKLNISKLISSNIEVMIKSAEQKNISILFDTVSDYEVYADEHMLNSTIRNLLSNALKFTAPNGKVTVQTKLVDNSTLEISLSDSGIGMPKDLLNNLFKMDEQVGRKGTSGESSTGLGLLLCKEFVEKHGGKIRAESTEGIGSTFYFTLPV